MNVKELIKILKTYPENSEVVVKDFKGASELWTPKEIKYVELMKQANKVLID